MRRLLVTLVLLCVAAPARAGLLYTYTGNTYGSLLDCCSNPAFPPTVTGPYTVNERISGWLLFDAPLPLAPSSNEWEYRFQPSAYAFSDGVQTLTANNSTIQFQYGGASVFGVGGWWSVLIQTAPVNGFVNSIETLATYAGQGGGSGRDIGWSGGNYGRVSPNPNPNAGNPGTWTTEEVPEPGTLLLVTLAALIVRRRRLAH